MESFAYFSSHIGKFSLTFFLFLIQFKGAVELDISHNQIAELPEYIWRTVFENANDGSVNLFGKNMFLFSR